MSRVVERMTAVSGLCIMISPLRTPADPCCRMKPVLTRSEDEAGVFHTINKTTAITLSIFQCISVNNQHLLVLKTEHAVAVTMLRVENLAGLPSSVRVGDAIFGFLDVSGLSTASGISLWHEPANSEC